jgi:hypothetical protein
MNGCATERREYNEEKVGKACALLSLKLGTGNTCPSAAPAALDPLIFRTKYALLKSISTTYGRTPHAQCFGKTPLSSTMLRTPRSRDRVNRVEMFSLLIG